MIIREVQKNDLSKLLELYTHLHNNEMPFVSAALENLWDEILSDPNHHVLIGIIDDRIISSCVLIIVPNLTHNQHPYALVENVITHPEFRRHGYAAKLLHQAKEIAVSKNCYKIMLMTSAKDEGVFQFYENAGYNTADKTAFIQWLSP